MLATAAFFASADASIKKLGAAMPVLLLLCLRYAFQTAFLAAWALLRGGAGLFRTEEPRLQALRGLLLLGNTSASFYGLQRVPLPEFTALMLMAPVISTVLSVLLLRARTSPAQWCLVLLAASGMLLVVRPGMGGLGVAAVLPLASAVCMAGLQLVSRQLSAREDLLATNFMSGSGVLCVMLAVLLASSIEVGPAMGQLVPLHWALVAVVGLTSTVGQVTMAAAFRFAPIAAVAPLSYAQIIFATALGVLFFGSRPDALSLTGMLMIAGGGAGTILANVRQR
jgi:drug/metabolite transporter (DMT)-like permease